MSYQLEVDCIRAARELNLLTTPYVFNPAEAKLMTEAGADIVVAQMGLTTSGMIGAQGAKSLDECAKDVQAILDTCKSIRPEVIVLCHGGPIAAPKEAQYLLDYCRGLDGFYGASSMERLPTEHAIVAETKKFSALQLSRKA